MATPLYDQMSSLITYANEITGASDTRLGDAVRTLAEGYGQGGDYACLIKDIVYTGTAQSGSVVLATQQELADAGIMYATNDGRTHKLSELWERTYIQLQKNDDYHEARVILKSESFYPPVYYNGTNGYHGQMFAHSSSATSGTSTMSTTPILSDYAPDVYGYPFLSSSHNIALAPNTTYKFARNYRLTVTCFGKKL